VKALIERVALAAAWLVIFDSLMCFVFPRVCAKLFATRLSLA